MDGNLALNAHFENLPEKAMKQQPALEDDLSPIDGLNMEQFEKIRNQIVEYIKMYSTDGETIGAWKILRYLQPYFKKGE